MFFDAVGIPTGSFDKPSCSLLYGRSFSSNSNHVEKKLIERITVDPLVMSGHPCIRGMRVTVSNILRLLANHHNYQRILDAYPYLEAADIDACLQYAALLADSREIEMVA